MVLFVVCFFFRSVYCSSILRIVPDLAVSEAFYRLHVTDSWSSYVAGIANSERTRHKSVWGITVSK